MKGIKKDHKGLYLCPPNKHGKQSKFKESGTSSKERKELSVKDGNE